ncbi:MAG: response regulator [Desulfovibrionales bacterium]
METDTAFLQNLAFRLRQNGVAVYEVEDPDDVKGVISKNPVEVALLDLNGLKQGGIKLLKDMKASWPEIEVIVINAPEQVTLSIEAMKMGAYKELHIPFDLASLLDMIVKAQGARKEKNP